MYIISVQKTTKAKYGTGALRDEKGRKLCILCAQWKIVEYFNKRQRTVDGLYNTCIECQAVQFRYHRYGVTKVQFESLLKAQDGCCAICRGSSPGGRGAWHIDHDHACCSSVKTCGACVRGLLCHRCNLGLGLFGDDREKLAAAIRYLSG